MLDMVTSTDRGEIVKNALAEAAREEERQIWKRMQPSIDRRCWYLLSVLPQAENWISATLIGLKVANVYSPLCAKDEVVWSRQPLTGKRIRTGIKRVMRPMLPGYLFVRCDYEAEWPKIRARVPKEKMSTVNNNNGAPYVIHNILMQALYEKELKEIGEKQNRTDDFKPGDAVRLLTGPFADWIGKIERLDSGERIRILLDLFGRGTPVVMSVSEIEAAR